jgi:hypothetical protein
MHTKEPIIFVVNNNNTKPIQIWMGFSYRLMNDLSRYVVCKYRFAVGLATSLTLDL